MFSSRLDHLKLWFQMVSCKFFLWNWGFLKEDIVRAVQKFFVIGIVTDRANDTIIILEVKNPQSIKDFQPISMCTVTYKIVSKCLVNRIRPLLDVTIPPT